MNLYKGHYLISFYDEDDMLVDVFDNVREIVVRGMGKEPTVENIIYANLLLYKALKRPDHHTRMLHGCSMTVHICDIND